MFDNGEMKLAGRQSLAGSGADVANRCGQVNHISPGSTARPGLASPRQVPRTFLSYGGTGISIDGDTIECRFVAHPKVVEPWRD